MEVKIHFLDKEELELRNAAKNIELENYCKVAVMGRIGYDAHGVYPILRGKND